MAVIDWDPRSLSEADVVLVYSDAADNTQAILEIDEWAAARGYLRVGEYWLPQKNSDKHKKRVFVGTCNRWTEANQREAEEACRRAKELRNKLPVTEHEF